MSKETCPTWVYHREKPAKIVQSDEAEELYKSGWKDSPAKCKLTAKKVVKK